jgi:[citrate (pro-3S)-lyase] ligase
MAVTFETLILESEKNAVISFLKSFNLKYDDDIEKTIIAKEGELIVGTASIAKNVIKCFAVLPSYQGDDLASKLMTLIIRELSERNVFHYFLYTPSKNIEVFKHLSFHVVVNTGQVAFMEGGMMSVYEDVLELKNYYKISDNEKAGLVMNCNPITNGHLHLIEKAANENDEVIVFVVEEDESVFPYESRFELVKKATKDLKNVSIVPSSKYLVSKLTFPTYFLKDNDDLVLEQTKTDVLVFKEIFMPIFNITKRYVGTEPYDETTNRYNDTMKEVLGDQLFEIDRLEIRGRAVSASIVRELIRTNNIHLTEELLPQTTFKFFNTEKGRAIVKKIKESEGRHS